MTSLEVFDPALCCATGVCGPQVEPHLARFEADLRWLSTRGAQVTRHNLGQEPGAFADHSVVRSILQSGGEDALPVILLDGRLRWTGHYPNRDELAAAAGSTVEAGVEATAAADASPDACCSPASAGGCC